MPGAWLGLTDPTLRGHFFFKKNLIFLINTFYVFFKIVFKFMF
jgi:hypothetical protein